MGERDRELETKMSGLRSEHAHKSQKGYGVGVFSVVLSEMQKGAKDYLGGWEDNHL